MSQTNNIIERTAGYVTGLFEQHADRKLPFHNLDHTQGVVDAAGEIGRKSDLSPVELEIVTLTAWLHDIGYLFTYTNHEEKSAETAREFLQEESYPEKSLQRVVACILATRMPQQPSDRLEEVMCDADMSHLRRKDFIERSEALRKEWELYMNETVSDVEWKEQTLRFMKEHHYFTPYAQTKFQSTVEDHMSHLQEDLMESRAEQRETIPAELSETHKKNKKKLKKLKKKIGELEGEMQATLAPDADSLAKIRTSAARLDRGIETMFRITSRNHIDLSAMADSKANILISVNSIIISIVASLMLSKLETHPWLMVPTILLISVCLATIIASILATRPKVTSGTFTQEDIRAKKVNLLFFGNFHGVDLDDYERGVYSMMQDPDYLYGTLIKDIYFLGNVLGRKYKYLRISYNIFMYGLIVSVVAYTIAVIAGTPTTAEAPL